MATTTTTTTPALFRFNIHNATTTTNLTYTHPIPTFLCHPTPSQKASPAFQTAYIDVLTLITSQHHTACMTALTSPCLSCASPTTDCLKAPSAFLDLAEPLVVINVYPVCGSRGCEGAVRRGLLAAQQQEMKAEEEEGKGFDDAGMECAVCGKEGAKRCAGCGRVGYCGKRCQSEGWKAHKRDCRSAMRRKKKEEEEEAKEERKAGDLPDEKI